MTFLLNFKAYSLFYITSSLLFYDKFYSNDNYTIYNQTLSSSSFISEYSKNNYSNISRSSTTSNVSNLTMISNNSSFIVNSNSSNITTISDTSKIETANRNHFSNSSSSNSTTPSNITNTKPPSSSSSSSSSTSDLIYTREEFTRLEISKSDPLAYYEGTALDFIRNFGDYFGLFDTFLNRSTLHSNSESPDFSKFYRVIYFIIFFPPSSYLSIKIVVVFYLFIYFFSLS